MIDDRRQVAEQIAVVARRLEGLAGWVAAPDGPFPENDHQLGELLGRVAVMLMAGSPASGDGPPNTGQGA